MPDPVRPVAPREDELQQLIAKWEQRADALSPESQRATGTVHEQCYRNESRAYRKCADELKAAAPVSCAASPAEEEKAFKAGVSYGIHYSGWTADEAWTEYKARTNPRATGEGARDDRHKQITRAGREDREVVTGGATADGIADREGRSENGRDHRAEGDRPDHARGTSDAPPIAVSLDPHRLLREIVMRHRRGIELSPGVGAAVQRYGLAVCDDILNDLECARLRGEAAVRVEADFICDGCGDPVTLARDMTTYHRKCDPASLEDQPR